MTSLAPHGNPKGSLYTPTSQGSYSCRSPTGGQWGWPAVGTGSVSTTAAPLWTVPTEAWCLGIWRDSRPWGDWLLPGASGRVAVVQGPGSCWFLVLQAVTQRYSLEQITKKMVNRVFKRRENEFHRRHFPKRGKNWDPRFVSFWGKGKGRMAVPPSQ